MNLVTGDKCVQPVLGEYWTHLSETLQSNTKH